MIALSEHLRNHGYDPRVETHTTIPKIWAKLETLYDLKTIDDRENSFEYETPDKFMDFDLPLEFAEKTAERAQRIPEEAESAASSPPRLRLSRSPSAEPSVTPIPRKRKKAETGLNKRRGSTVDDTDEPRTSPANSPAPKIPRGGRGTNKTMGRMKAESRSRQESKETTADEDDNAEETEDVAEDDEDAEEDDDGTPSVSLKAPKSTSRAKADAQTTRKSKRKR
jgi:hypothetical protein